MATSVAKDGVHQKWHSNGTKYLETTNVNGKKHGLYQTWYSNGTKHEVTTYSNGKIHGLYQTYHPNGTKRVETTYSNGKIHGLYQAWWPNGTKYKETTSADGEIHGSYQEWYDNGNKYLETIYANGKMHGLHQRYHEDGRSDYTHEYCDDKLIRVVSLRDDEDRECVLPEGDITVWKASKSGYVNVYVQLEVPKEAKRVTPDNFKFKTRVMYANVVRIVDADGKEYKSATSFVYRFKPLLYEVGKTVWPDGYDDDVSNACGKGINVHLHKDHCDQWFK
jgi:hypothetical protein